MPAWVRQQNCQAFSHLTMRIATFNLENLFRRAKVLNLRDSEKTTKLLDKIRQLASLLDEPAYTAPLRAEVFNLSAELREYIDIRKDFGTLGSWRKDTHTERTGFRVSRQAKGRSSWSGQIVFRFEDFSDQQRMNTALVVNSVNADIFCAIEVEGMEALRVFNRSVAATSYSEYIAIDSPNDPRGIDIGCLTRYHISSLITHVFDFVPGTKRRIFSRDCLELAIDRDEDTRIHVLCNHFKSQMGAADESAAKRLEQARAVAAILDRYDLAKQYVVVMGDLNEDISSTFGSLHPLLQKNGLHPVVDPALPMNQRYTHYYEDAGAGRPKLTQLDYIFVSEALRHRITGYGFERRGIHGIDAVAAREGAEPITPFPTVTGPDLSASDHAALWVDLDL